MSSDPFTIRQLSHENHVDSVNHKTPGEVDCLFDSLHLHNVCEERENVANIVLTGTHNSDYISSTLCHDADICSMIARPGLIDCLFMFDSIRFHLHTSPMLDMQSVIIESNPHWITHG